MERNVKEENGKLTRIWIAVKIAIVLYLPRNESARKPPSKQSRKEVPIKSVTILAEVELGKCIVPTKYVTRFTAMPIVESLSHISIPEQLLCKSLNIYIYILNIDNL